MARAPGTRRRRAGRVMIGVAVVGVLVAVAAVVVGWSFLERVNDSTRDSLTVTIETIDSVEQSIDLVDEVLDAVSETIEGTGSTLGAVVESFDATTGVVDTVQGVLDDVGPTLDGASASLRSLEEVADGLDSLLRRFSDIPFAPSYDEDLALGPSIGDVADDVESLPDTFSQASTDLDGFTSSVNELSGELEALAASVDEIVAGLGDREELIEQYRSNVTDARTVAVDTRDGLDGDVGWLRLLLVLGGLNFGVGQIVPFWVGRNLIREADALSDEVAVADLDDDGGV